jgi:hypothetical protein
MQTEEGIVGKGPGAAMRPRRGEVEQALLVPATVGPTIDADAMRDAERRLWAGMTADDSA